MLNFKPVITGVGVVLQLDMLNIFKNTLANLYYDINIPLSDYWTSMPRENFIIPKSVISNSLSMTALNYSIPKSQVNIKSYTYRQTINILPFLSTLVYKFGSLSLL